MAAPVPFDATDRSESLHPRAAQLARDIATGATPGPVRPMPEIRQPLVDAVVHDVRLYDRVGTLTRAHFDATLAYDTARTHYNRETYAAQIEHVRARADFVSAMGQVYRDPADAVRRFESDLRLRTAHAAVETLTTAPETYGTLRTTERTAWAVWLRRGDETPARLAAHDAAVRAITVEHRRVEALDVPRVRETLHEALQRVESTATELRSLPTATRLERDVRAALRDITPGERRAVAAQLTDAQRAFMHTLGGVARDTARDIALGRDGRER